MFDPSWPRNNDEPLLPRRRIGIVKPKPEPDPAAVAACQDAADRCSCVVAGFFRVVPDAIFKSTRGAAAEAFPRQILMAGLVVELGFSAMVVGSVIKRDDATVMHACRIIEALRGGLTADDLVDILGEDGVREYLNGQGLQMEWHDKTGARVDLTDGADTSKLTPVVLSGAEAVEEFIETTEQLIDDLFDAFKLVAVRGKAYCDHVARLNAERIAREGAAHD